MGEGGGSLAGKGEGGEGEGLAVCGVGRQGAVARNACTGGRGARNAPHGPRWTDSDEH